MKRTNRIMSLLLALMLMLSLCACGQYDINTDKIGEAISDTLTQAAEDAIKEGLEQGFITETDKPSDTPSDNDTTQSVTMSGNFDLTSIPEYSGEPYIVINDNVPYFTEDDLTTEVFEHYSELDDLGRCGVAYANICKELMPTDSREDIGSVKPSGWNNKPYDWVDGRYIYNRCHIIGFQLAGENANKLNLITGTRSMNVDAMLLFENLVDDYVDETNNHVLYRVTPIYEGDNLVASGVLMEGMSVEDKGDGVLFCVYCYNVEPGCVIDYATGDNWAADETDNTALTQTPDKTSDEMFTYVINTKTNKFHDPSCSGATGMSAENKTELKSTYDALVAEGYTPCGSCQKFD